MPTSNALMGVGLPGEVARRLGYEYSPITATGTSQGAAAKMLNKFAEVSAAANQTGVVAPAAAELMDDYTVCNLSTSTASAVFYVPSGHSLNGASNGSFTIAAGKAATMWQYKPTFWAGILSS